MPVLIPVLILALILALIFVLILDDRPASAASIRQSQQNHITTFH
jgi:hypothetical protein